MKQNQNQVGINYIKYIISFYQMDSKKKQENFLLNDINYGFSLINEFDKLYISFQIILEEDESLDYNLFVFGEERTCLIRTILLIIRQFQPLKDVTKAMYFFVKDRYNIIFANVEPKLEESYRRVHFVMAKLLSNVVNK